MRATGASLRKSRQMQRRALWAVLLSFPPLLGAGSASTTFVGSLGHNCLAGPGLRGGGDRHDAISPFDVSDLKDFDVCDPTATSLLSMRADAAASDTFWTFTTGGERTRRFDKRHKFRGSPNGLR